MSTVSLHRVFKAPADRVYRAFIDPKAMVKWLPPHGFVGEVHRADQKVGGSYRMSFTNFNTGQSHSFGGRYLEMVPGQRLKHTDQFDDPNMPGEMIVTVTFREVKFPGAPACTEVHITQENIPAMIPVEMCYLGWQESLHLLAHVVEPEIPG